MFLGDVVHCPVQLEDDERAVLFDVDPALAKRTRNVWCCELEGTNVRTSGAYFPEIGLWSSDSCRADAASLSEGRRRRRRRLRLRCASTRDID